MTAAETSPQMAGKHLRAKNFPPRSFITSPQRTNFHIKFVAPNRTTAPSVCKARAEGEAEAAVRLLQFMRLAAAKAVTSRPVQKTQTFFTPEAKALCSPDMTGAQEWNATSKFIRDFSPAKPLLPFPIAGSGHFQSYFRHLTPTSSTRHRNFFTKQPMTARVGRKSAAI